MSMLALETKSLCKTFGALAVASDINFKLERGARHALIGPNGAGKTSFVNLVTGVLTPTSGQILLGGEDITSLTRAQRVKRGLVRTFQISALFRKLTVLENVTLAIAEREGVANDLLRPAGHHRALIANPGDPRPRSLAARFAKNAQRHQRFRQRCRRHGCLPALSRLRRPARHAAAVTSRKT